MTEKQEIVLDMTRATEDILMVRKVLDFQSYCRLMFDEFSHFYCIKKILPYLVDTYIKVGKYPGNEELLKNMTSEKELLFSDYQKYFEGLSKGDDDCICKSIYSFFDSLNFKEHVAEVEDSLIDYCERYALNNWQEKVISQIDADDISDCCDLHSDLYGYLPDNFSTFEIIQLGKNNESIIPYEIFEKKINFMVESIIEETYKTLFERDKKIIEFVGLCIGGERNNGWAIENMKKDIYNFHSEELGLKCDEIENQYSRMCELKNGATFSLNKSALSSGLRFLGGEDCDIISFFIEDYKCRLELGDKKFEFPNDDEGEGMAEFAKWVAEYVFRNQMELWGEQMEKELTTNLEIISGERGTASSLLGLLEKEFTTSDLIKLRAKKGQSVTSTSINSLLCRWKKTNRIEKLGEGKWKRLI